MSDAFSWPVRVYYEDTDLSGVVYHANYLRFFERARTEWLRSLGFDQERLMQEQGIAFTVASLNIQYQQPARLDDELEVTVVVIRSGRASMQLEQQIHMKAKPEHILAALSCRVGCVGITDFRPAAMPAVIDKAIKGV